MNEVFFIMKVVIMGGGKLGYYLSRNLLERGYKISLIEKDKNKCSGLVNELGIEIVCGDGTEIKPLTDAEVFKADCFIAVTGKDQDNLVACQLVKKKFMVEKVISRANNPKNLETMRELGIDNAVSSTEIITRMIEQEIDDTEIQLVASLNKGKVSICSITLPMFSSIDGRTIKSIILPPDSLIISILRDERLIIPQGDTVLYNGDEIIAICNSSDRKHLKKIFSETLSE